MVLRLAALSSSQLVRLFIDKHEARRVGVHHLFGNGHDVLEYLIKIERGADEGVDVDER